MAAFLTQREKFDIPENIAYFNCSYNSPILNVSRDAMIAGAAFKSHPWKRTAANFFEDAETIRALASELFGGDKDGYAIVPAASYAISTAARIIEPSLSADDKILLIDEDFPSNVLPWQRTAAESGATIITVPTPEDGDWTKAILAHIDNSVKVVAGSHCHWTNGAYIDLAEVSAACKSQDAILVVDATQTLGAQPFSMDEIQPDFLTSSGYKWLLCPYGFSLLYVGEKWRDARPLEESWLARLNAEDFAGLVNYSDIYMTGARRFEMGEKCAATLLPGVIAALTQIKEWSTDMISNSLGKLNDNIIPELETMGFCLPEESLRSRHMFGAILPATFEGNLVSELMKENIYISQRGKSLRFAPHLHINDNDVDRLIENLKMHIRK